MKLASKAQHISRNILDYLSFNKEGLDYDKSDLLGRTGYKVLECDLLDNLENNLNENQKVLNILKILLGHYQHNTVISNDHSWQNALLEIISAQFGNLLAGLQLSTKKTEYLLRNKHNILEKMYPAEFEKINKSALFDKFTDSLTRIVIVNRTFWEGKAVSKVGRKNKIADTIVEFMKTLYNKELSNEEKYYKIQPKLAVIQTRKPDFRK